MTSCTYVEPPGGWFFGTILRCNDRLCERIEDVVNVIVMMVIVGIDVMSRFQCVRKGKSQIDVKVVQSIDDYLYW